MSSVSTAQPTAAIDRAIEERRRLTSRSCATSPDRGRRSEPAGRRPAREDAQQLIEVLAGAQGRSLTFAELAAAGIALPQAVSCQLELVGAPVQRVSEDGVVVGARFDG